MKNVTAIILAAGKGTRMKISSQNKVTLEVQGKPILLRTLKTLQETGIHNLVVVVGHKKESVIKLLGEEIMLAEQKKRLGTGHAVKVALKKVPKDSKDVLIVYGDDAFMYDSSIFQSLLKTHNDTNAKITFITMISKNPTGYGRILRDDRDEIVGIVEEKNATDEEKKINEINLGCYVIDKNYLDKNLKHIKKNPVSGEYYITDIIDLIAHNKDKISGYRLSTEKWRGVNTPEDLKIAESMLS